jgi:beta-lactamase superfamily II metal-dependent hydrolase
MKKKKSAAEAQAIAAAFVDKSVYNLSSMAMLATRKKRTMLLTGDARGDYLLDGLRAAKLMKNDTIHVDLLKVPHHGSDRNVDDDFFRRITADRYVISADGRHDNPDPRMLKMLTTARGKAAYTIYLTNRVPAVDTFFETDRAKGRKYDVVYRDPDALSVAVPLEG